LIRFREYIIVFAVAAIATWLATFVVRALAKRHSLLVLPDERRVHERPTPTAGGAAMYFGLLVAIATASQMPAFAPVFKGSSAPIGVVLAATVIFGVGMADDVREMSPPAKLAGQVLAGTVLYFFGVDMLFFHVPLAQTTVVLSPDLAVLTTVLWVAVMANSVNFIDGLDGLATGIVAIGAGAFFVYSHQLGVVGNIQASNAGPLIAIVAVGLAVGFLPHNFYPAKIFMGDGGAMLLGVLVAASTLAVVGQDPYEFSGRTYFFFAPILIPFFILGIPLLDTVFAIVRRAGQRTSPAVADLNHLHHRLMRLGHGQRRAVIILWLWTALLSGIVLWPGVTNSHNEIPPIAVGGLSILLYTLFAPRGRTTIANADNNAHEAGNGSPVRNGSTVRGESLVRTEAPGRNGAAVPSGAPYLAAVPHPGTLPATRMAGTASAAERSGAAGRLTPTGTASLEGFPVTGAALVAGAAGQRNGNGTNGNGTNGNGNGDTTVPLTPGQVTPPRGLPALRMPKPPN
jgi:UDP-GlcNAc:undecaprenyl-phosphate/decaprenyl-phosphate GlcNAc-1-phosphate transferase